MRRAWIAPRPTTQEDERRHNVANLHYEFRKFHNRIALTDGRKATMKHARETIRDRISKYFLNTLRVSVPKFRSQGAYAMDTPVNPLGGVYDIDDGIYLQHLDKLDNRGWPAPETAHLWVINATDDHADEKPVNRKTCVRLKHAGHYQVDLPIYAEFRGKYYLAECGARGWHRSDPLALTYWFLGAIKTHGEQLRRMVHYLKAWADFQSESLGKMPNGLILTVCAVRNFVSDERDDIAWAQTLQSMEYDVDALVYILNPVDINEELSARLTGAQKERFQHAIQGAVADAKKAVECEDKHVAARFWCKQWGDRFPTI